MKQIFRGLFVLVAFGLCLHSKADSLTEGGDSARDAVWQMVSKMKSEGAMGPMLDFVHWPTAFEGFPVSERAKLGITSPEKMHEYFSSVLSNPERLPGMMMEKLSALPPQEREKVEKNMNELVTIMKRKQAEMKEKIQRTSYSIGEVSVQGGSATVELVSTLDGQSKHTVLPMELHEGKWYLPTMKLLEEQKQKTLQ
ncbi:MAG: hypothetical protein KDD64_13045 [Bdellovibrionales bacterium]|nr:hypothetical protein [Bdellovibrionales bacterium]